MYDRYLLQILDYHDSMLADELRTQSYLRAVQHTVRPGDVVLDIGAGTGILALFACLAGARKVYAVEQGPVIEIARRVCRENGFEDRVTFVNDWSTRVELPERADLLITETVGNIGFEEGILGWVIDAKKRLLAPDARIIPRTVELAAVPVESEDDYYLVDSWLEDFYSFSFSAARTVAANNLHPTELSPKSFLGEPAYLARVDLAAVTSANAADIADAAGVADAANVGGSASFVVTRSGVMHGIGCWFRSELAAGITVSNAPPNQVPSWTHGFLPLEKPLPLTRGDQLRVEIQAAANSAHWAWKVAKDGYMVQEAVSREILHSDQTTLSGQLLPGADGGAIDRAPARSKDAEVDLFILRLMDGATPITEIARQTAAQFSADLDFENARSRVLALCQHYRCQGGRDARST